MTDLRTANAADFAGAGGQRMTGGELVAEVLEKRGISELFTLCGGHISPILVAAKRLGIRVVDVRDEASAVFAADAVARLTGRPGVAAVTAGPGLTNTITAVKNAQLAQSPVVVLGGATGTILKGRGSLQDIDQMALMEPHVKWLASVERVRDLVPAVEEALTEASLGVPGPVFVECPVDLLYDEQLVRKQYGQGSDSRSLAGKLIAWYLGRHLDRMFSRADQNRPTELTPMSPLPVDGRQIKQVARLIRSAKKPVLLVGSQATLDAARIGTTAAAVGDLGIPVYLSGMARGLLGAEHERLFRHRRRKALGESDLVILAGVPCDFRLDYGRHVPRTAKLVSFNLSAHDLRRNRRPNIGVLSEPARCLRALARELGETELTSKAAWCDQRREQDRAREAEIGEMAARQSELINPVQLCLEIEKVLDEDSVLIADGGDFIATASYTLRPRGPLRWLDPGVFGTLGVGGGFAIGAAVTRDSSEIWLFYGDGSSAYSLAEFDTYVRHGLPVIAVVGNDASWMQIAREQVEILGDDCGTVLRRSDYHQVAEGYGGTGILVERPRDVPAALAKAKEIARSGSPVLINAMLGTTDFRKGSISM